MFKQIFKDNIRIFCHGLATIIGGIGYFIMAYLKPRLLDGDFNSWVASISLFLIISIVARVLILLFELEINDEGGYYY